jgi:hypothetical protein
VLDGKVDIGALALYALVDHTHAEYAIGSPIPYSLADHAHTKAGITDFSDSDYATASQGILADTAVQSGANISIFTNNSGYLTSESDPVFSASAAAGIGSPQITDWNTAYGWGDHDGLYANSDHNHDNDYASIDHSHSGLVPAGGSTGQVLKKTSGTDYAYGWASDLVGEGGVGSPAFVPHDHDEMYYTESEVDTLIENFITAETDPVFGASEAANITNTDTTNWDTAYGWGNHSGLYAASGHDHSGVYSVISHTHTLGDLIGGSPLPLFSETDPVFGASEAANITSTDTTNWDTAYGWGDHGGEGYLTSADIVGKADLTGSPQVVPNNQISAGSITQHTSSLYSASGHDHDSDYSAIGHDHDSDYSAIGHDHDNDYAPLTETINGQTGTTYTLALTDRAVSLTNSSAITLTVPANATVEFPVGTAITIVQLGAGQATIAGASGVSVNTASTLLLRAQYSGAMLLKTATNTWVLIGDMEEA